MTFGGSKQHGFEPLFIPCDKMTVPCYCALELNVTFARNIIEYHIL
jgi:hypothetical protein